jgi:hypothetical protein
VSQVGILGKKKIKNNIKTVKYEALFLPFETAREMRIKIK